MASRDLLDLYVDRTAYSAGQVLPRSMVIYGYMEDPVRIERDVNGHSNLEDDDLAMVNGVLIKPRKVKITELLATGWRQGCETKEGTIYESLVPPGVVVDE